MKFDFTTWGFTLFGSFVVFIVTLVVFASLQKVDLVTDTYYEEELDFRKVRNQEERARRDGWSIRLEPLGNRLRMTLISEKFFKQGQNKVYGYLYLYKPDAQEHDRQLYFKTDTEVFEWERNGMAPGYYQVKLEWAPISIPLSQGYAHLTRLNLPHP